jgi:hypothetical protein
MIYKIRSKNKTAKHDAMGLGLILLILLILSIDLDLGFQSRLIL